MKGLIVTLLILVSAACSTSNVVTNPVLSRLKNRGPLVLSSDNPYVASNMMLQKAMDESPEVKGFVEHRGAPTVLEVKQSFLSSPVMFFYYPENGEYYRLENDKTFWLIEGPFQIDENKMKALQPLTLVQLSTQEKVQPTPVGRQTPPLPKETRRKGKPKEERPPDLEPAEKMIPLQEEPVPMELSEAPRRTAPVPTLAAAVPPPAAAQRQETGGSARRAGEPNQDQEIVQNVIAAGGHATGELTPKGDLVHYVTYPDEDLALIARWYTFDAWNAGKIARVSGITQKQPLSVGDTLVIPSYLLKNKVRLTEEGLSALRQAGR